MKYNMIQSSGALQEGVANYNKQSKAESLFDECDVSANEMIVQSAMPVAKSKAGFALPSFNISSNRRSRVSAAPALTGGAGLAAAQDQRVISQTRAGTINNIAMTQCGGMPAQVAGTLEQTDAWTPTESEYGFIPPPPPEPPSLSPDASFSHVDRQIYTGKASGPTYHNLRLQERKSMFFYTIPEGMRVLVTDKHGRSQIVDGPRRMWRWGYRFQNLQQYTAYPGEFLIVKYRNGSQNHIPGPSQEWLDPRTHTQIEKNDGLQIAGKEAVVVYSKDTDDRLARRIVFGPTLFIPKPGEWLHTFHWHGSKDSSYKKVPGGLVFQKLWLMPDQMYHDVEGVCTADDVTLTIKLMIFFELTNLERMLEGTHDPLGDFINATSSDVIDFVKRYTFDNFKSNSEKLNDLAAYPQLVNRAEQVGYVIRKIVYRGYTTAEALQAMQNRAIETRTKLKLERETEEQTQKLADYKQKCEAERAIQIHLQEQEEERCEVEKLKIRRQNEKDQELWELEKSKLQQQQQMEIQKLQHEQHIQQQQQQDQQKLEFLRHLKEIGVDLTSYLTQSRADQVIELRSANQQVSPHLHLDSSSCDYNEEEQQKG